MCDQVSREGKNLYLRLYKAYKNEIWALKYHCLKLQNEKTFFEQLSAGDLDYILKFLISMADIYGI